MRKNSGFSILELLVVIGIFAIIVSIGVPGLLNYRQKAQLGKASRDIYAGLQRAKMEATRNNRFCVFNFSPVNVGGTDYDFHIFLEESAVRNFDYDPGVDRFVTGFRAVDYPGVNLDTVAGGATGITFPIGSLAGDQVVAFAPDGLPKTLGGALNSGSIFFNDGGENGRQISVSLAGTIQITQYEAD